MFIISPSVLASDFSRLGEEAAAVEKCGAQYLHLDVMDGCFVPNISMGPCVISSIRPHSKAVFDVHLMIENPFRYIEDYVKAGADIITFHYESSSPVEETVDKILACGCKAGISVKPATPVEKVFSLLDKLSMVLVMTVEPGFGGQKFMDSTVEKITALRRETERRGLNVDIEVDGGINAQTAAVATRAGANVLVAGSSVFGAEDRAKAVADLLEVARNNPYCG